MKTIKLIFLSTIIAMMLTACTMNDTSTVTPTPDNNSVSDSVKNIGDDTSDTVKDVGDAAGDVVEGVGDTAGDIVEGVDNDANYVLNE